jgi:uncharacterized protein (TIGR01777 family)
MDIRKVLISGASGMIGSSLVRVLDSQSIQTVKLIRPQGLLSLSSARWDPFAAKPVSDLTKLDDLDAAVHLSGASVAARRWSAAYQREIVTSRVESTRALAKLLASLKRKPKVFVCASAVGFYGDRGDELLSEDSPAGRGFLVETCQAWEAATGEAEEAGIRVAHARFGVVLTPQGGALAKLLPIFRLGLGGRLGSGRQWMSWITLEDAVRAILRAVEDESLRGAVNVVAPKPATNAEFTRALARALHRPAMVAVPGFVLRIAVGKMADEGLLASTRATPKRLLDSGFEFRDPELETALRLLLPG